MEIDTIDGSFLGISDVAPPLRVELGRDLRDRVLRWTGLPTCVGIGPTSDSQWCLGWVSSCDLGLDFGGWL